MYAIIELGSHQYRVNEDDDVTVFRRNAEEGEEIELEEVLFVSEDGDTQIGEPYLDGATVEATVEEHYRGDKITVFKYKQREGKRRKLGHRDELTRLSINNINT